MPSLPVCAHNLALQQQQRESVEFLVVGNGCSQAQTSCNDGKLLLDGMIGPTGKNQDNNEECTVYFSQLWYGTAACLVHPRCVCSVNLKSLQ